ncbi:large subunit GTPase 1-like protein [Platysternon megacephalum]|uniref:Large subunit GTPase 1-like protein n=1 Tax=Platysternon megacephalum TaxID=55544 RepID=A0A4D9DWB9_9SAUR|nr:large subunit GTPase 1-like protein [Platysternon megacephalum]
MTASHRVRCVGFVRILSPPTLFFPFGFDPKEQKGNSETAGQSVSTRSQGHLVPGRIRPMACVLCRYLSYCSSALAVLILRRGGWKRMEGPYDRATVLCL